MSSLVAFDQKGAFGPAMTLIYNASYYNINGIMDLAHLLKENFMRLSQIKPKGKKEFCAFVLKKNQEGWPIAPEEIIRTRFFQNMQKAGHSANHAKVLSLVVPQMMKTVQEHFPRAKRENEGSQPIEEWAARFVECYMTDEQIAKHCTLQASVPEKILDERKNIGMELYKAATAKQLSGKDLDALIEIGQAALKQLQTADHSALTLNLAGRYLTLFAMNETNPSALGEDVLHMLSTVFRQKFKDTLDSV